MADVKEQRICIEFCFKFNKSAAETHRMLKQAFGAQALSQARTFEYNKRDSKKNDIRDKETNQQSQTTGHTEVKNKKESNNE